MKATTAAPVLSPNVRAVTVPLSFRHVPGEGVGGEGLHPLLILPLAPFPSGKGGGMGEIQITSPIPLPEIGNRMEVRL